MIIYYVVRGFKYLKQTFIVILFLFVILYKPMDTHNEVYDIDLISNIKKNLYNSKTEYLSEVLQYLTDRDYQVIEQNYKYYHWAAKICDIPEELLIAIHYRESKLYHGYYSFKRKVLVKNLGGPFMLDCGGQGTDEFKANIRYEECRIAKKYNFKGDTRVSHNFIFACLVAADYIKNKTRYDLNTEHGVADMFWGYNGRAHKSYLHSAYVCSDPKNGKKMSFIFKGREIVDVNPGCLAIWRELKNSKKLLIITSKYH